MADAPFPVPRLKRMSELAEHGDTQGLRELIEAEELRQPGYWKTAPGRLHLRGAALGARKLSIIQLICGQCGLPPLAIEPDEIGANLSLTPSSLYLSPRPTSSPHPPLPSPSPPLLRGEGGLATSCIPCLSFTFSSPLC